MFEKHIKEFNENIIELRDFVDQIDEFLNERHNEKERNFNTLFMSAAVNKILEIKKEWDEDEYFKYTRRKEELDAEILDIYKTPVVVEIEPIRKTEEQEKAKFKLTMKTKGKIDPDLLNIHQSKNHIYLLYKNSFISLLSSIEWFFSQILHYYYSEYPASAGIQKKTMTLEELKSFGSLNDAEKYLIDSKIEEILRGDFLSWITLLKAEFKLKLDYVEMLEDELIEIYQRRNLLVHNGGVVNSIYVSKVKQSVREDVRLGDELTINKEYLDGAICKLQRVFILIASELWKKVSKEDERRGEVLSEIIYENLVKARWDISEGLSLFVINDAKSSSVDKVVAQLNNWLCKKRIYGLESVQEEMLKADFSDKREIFQLGLFSLLEDKVSFFEKLPVVMDSGELDKESLEEFPIFDEMRTHDEYRDFIDNYKTQVAGEVLEIGGSVPLDELDSK